MNEQIISVIIPVYKVEPYLRKCLDSVVGQTYRNLEIILVDDGSPDNCGAICDEYAAKDGRIKVIHQQNAGLSAARNAGLRIASGEYLGFVDSDDWIEPEMFGTLLNGLRDTSTDIAVCGRYEEYKDHKVPYCWPEVQVLDTEQALGELLRNDRMQNLVWDKLYRKGLFEEVWFPEGKTFEDMAVMHWLFLRAKKVVCLPAVMYHYLHRAESIVGDVSLKNRLNHYEMAWARYEALSENWPQYADLMAAQCVASAVTIWSVYHINSAEDQKKYLPQIKQISAFAKEHSVAVFEQMNLGIAGRMIVRLVPYTTWWAFAGARLCGLLYQIKHGRAL